jgi:hypothetical protein
MFRLFLAAPVLIFLIADANAKALKFLRAFP